MGKGRRSGLFVLLWTLAAGSALPARDRGDLNGDGAVDVSDLAELFTWLVSEEAKLRCPAVADVNADGRLDYSDAVYFGLYLFADGAGPVPFPPRMIPCVDPATVVTLRELHVVPLTPRSAMATWETPLRTPTLLRFGESPDLLDRTIEINESTLFHQAVLRDLTPGTVYFYQVLSADGDRITAASTIERFQSLPELSLAVRLERPRLLLTASDISQIRQRIQRQLPSQELWQEIERWCLSKLVATAESLIEADDADRNTRAFALAWLLSGNTKFRDKALELALSLVSRQEVSDLRAKVEALAYTYDWLYPELSADNRKLILTSLVRGARHLLAGNESDGFVTGHNHGNNKSAFLALLAAYGDAAEAVGPLETIATNYRHGFLASWRRFAGVDGGSWKGWWYSSYALPFTLEFLAAWRTATGEDIFQAERGWCEGMLDWFVFGMRGDRSFLREGDGRVFNGMNFQDRHYGRLLAREYGNPLAQWFAKTAAQQTAPWGPNAVLDLLWSDFTLAPEVPSGASVRHFRHAGVVIMKGDWKRHAPVASFRSAESYTLGHSHRDNLSYTLYYKGALALDSGIYDEYGSKHYWNYYTRSVAHNTVTVFDPDEKFGLYGHEYANDGGQRWLQPGEDVATAWPETAEATIERSAGYRLGGMVRHEDTPEYTYTMGDGAPAYHRKKVKRFLRHFLWLKQVDGWALPVMLVFDDVASTQASFKKSYLLHTATQPVVKGGVASVRNGEGKLFHATLAPQDAVLTPVGGPEHEFWVNGVNYPPTRAPRADEDGGNWRLEVSPAAPSRDDRFLHALYPAEIDDAAPAPAAAFTAGSLQVCEIGAWTVLFDFGPLPDSFTYPNRRPSARHLVFGASPNALYKLLVDDVHVADAQASFSGTLRFDVETAGAVTLARVP